MALDFRLARVDPNFAANVQQSFEQGRERGRISARDAALANYTTDPEGTATAVMGIDPGLGIQLATVNRQNAAQDATMRHQQAEEQRLAHERGSRVVAAVLNHALQIRDPNPARQEQMRRAFLTSTAAQMGQLNPEAAPMLQQEAANVGVDDATLQGHVASLAGEPAGYTLGTTRFSGFDQPVASVEGPPTVINTPEGGTTTIIPRHATPIPGRGGAQPAPMASAPAQDGPTAAPGAPVEQGGQEHAGGFNRDLMARLLIGEGVQGPGQVAVANVVFNRARALGLSPDQVITQPHQFEPYGNHERWQQLQAIPTTDPRYQAALQAIDQAQQQDITGGATHFYSPAVMAQRGGPPTWAQGHEGQDIGGNTFLRLPLGRGGQGGQAPAEAPAGQSQTTNPDGTITIHGAPRRPPTVAQGRPPTAEERARGIDFVSANGEPHYPPAGAQNGGHRPATGATLNALNLQADNVRTAAQIDQQLGHVEQQLANGQLHLGPVTNLVAQGRNVAGMGDENSRNFASFRATMERMRNDSLRLNRGVQTEGDAQRAWNELFANINDQSVVTQRLREIRAYNRQALAYHQDIYAQSRSDAGLAPFDPLAGPHHAMPAEAAPAPHPAPAAAPPTPRHHAAPAAPHHLSDAELRARLGL